MAEPTNGHPSPFPERPVERLSRPLKRFLRTQAAGGLVLMAATVVALVAANSPLAESWSAFWNSQVIVGVSGFKLDYPLWYWINDGLMTIFFFVIGLEIKRELVWGELRDRRKVILPAAAALGGAVVPVAIYLTLQPSPPASDGWAVPMATDIAFVVGCLALLGKRVPNGLKVFLLSLAILDDILAVLVIALFFSAKLKVVFLVGALLGLGVIVLLNQIGVRRVGAYVLMGVVVWVCTLKSGIHPTVAGAIMGLLTPASAWLGDATLLDVIGRVVPVLDGGRVAEAGQAPRGHARRAATEDLSWAAKESVAPLDRLEHALHPWVSFAIMPIFALANAGIALGGGGSTSISVAVAAGLVIGKPLGIVVVAIAVVRTGVAPLPDGTGWGALLGGGMLSGIGFTMALFIASLSLTGPELAAAKTGILAGSLVSMALGLVVLRLTLREPPATQGQPPAA